MKKYERVFQKMDHKIPNLKFYLSIFILFLMCLSCSPTKTTVQQLKIVRGVIYDQNGYFVAGANVMNMITFRGVQTDLDGKFELQVIEGDILKISLLGYKEKKIKVTEQIQYRIELEEVQMTFYD